MSRFTNRLPQSALDRYAAEHPEEALQATASQEPTRQHCAATGLPEGADGSTHHLLPRAKGQTCRYCGKTEKQIRSGS